MIDACQQCYSIANEINPDELPRSACRKTHLRRVQARHFWQEHPSSCLHLNTADIIAYHHQ